MYRQCRDKENEAWRSTAAIAALTEDHSMRSYGRKRKLQSFETPPSKRAKPKSHSPNFTNVTWDKEEVLKDLESHPPAPPQINWQSFARQHNIPGKNCGQVVKEFAVKSGINVSRLEGVSESKTRQRSMLRRLPAGEISAPADPPSHVIKKEWTKMVESGKLSLGIPCVPFKLVKFMPSNGELVRNEISITGRKFPLQEVRQKLLKKHEMYMRLNQDDEISKMTVAKMQSFLVKCKYPTNPHSTSDQLYATIRKVQRTRTLVLWHDHGVLLGLGCILMTIHIAYDPAVFYTPQEYKERFGKPVEMQSIIERPELYILAAGSSSSEDQAALIRDRLDCLHDLPVPITATNGVCVEDKLTFFIGDHPAQQYERGTQHGGTYKCACACKQSMFEDFAHTVHCEWWSLYDIQKIATSGKYGK